MSDDVKVTKYIYSIYMTNDTQKILGKECNIQLRDYSVKQCQIK